MHFRLQSLLADNQGIAQMRVMLVGIECCIWFRLPTFVLYCDKKLRTMCSGTRFVKSLRGNY